MKLLSAILFFTLFLSFSIHVERDDKSFFNDANFEYSLSKDQTTLTFYDPQFKQMYRVEGMADLPSKINTKGLLWYEEGFLSIRQRADSYLSFTTKETESPPGTSYRVKSISKFSGPELAYYIQRMHKEEGLTLSDIELQTSCGCIVVDKNRTITNCNVGGFGAVGCGISNDGNSCEVSCGEGFTACCR